MLSSGPGCALRVRASLSWRRQALRPSGLLQVQKDAWTGNHPRVWGSGQPIWRSRTICRQHSVWARRQSIGGSGSEAEL